MEKDEGRLDVHGPTISCVPIWISTGILTSSPCHGIMGKIQKPEFRKKNFGATACGSYSVEDPEFGERNFTEAAAKTQDKNM